jgi:tetratricopeptide (TPR) repeat protein
VEAAQLFQQAYDAWHHPAFLYNKGQSLERASQWQGALDAFQGYVTGFEGPDAPAGEQLDPLVYIQIAECQHRLGHRDEAAQAMQRYLAQSPQGDLAAGVRQCVQSGQPPSTIGERNPQDVEAARRIFDEAVALYDRGQYRQAAERFLECYRQHGDMPEVLYDAAASYREARMWAEAVSAFEQYLQTPGADPDVYAELAQCEHQQEHFEQAVAAYRRCLELNPQGPFAQEAREYIQAMTAVLERGENAPSPELLRRASQAFERGSAHFNAGRYRQALQEFSQAQQLVPARATQFNMAMCQFRMRDWGEALTAFENYLRDGDTGDDAVIHLRAAECELELERPSRAQTHIETYLQRADEADLPEEDLGRRLADQLMQRVRQATAPSGG